MASRNKHLVFVKQAEIFKAIAHPVRVAIVDCLKDGEQCVCDIAEQVGAERSNVSRHLAVMVNAGVLEYHKEGLKVIYKIKTSCILDFFSCTARVLKEQAKDNERLLRAL